MNQIITIYNMNKLEYRYIYNIPHHPELDSLLVDIPKQIVYEVLKNSKELPKLIEDYYDKKIN